MAAARLSEETGPTLRKCPFLAAISPFDDVRCCDVINDETRVRFRARSGESWVIKAVALAVLVDR